MGTNYYHRHNICDSCDRYDELHICKSYRTFRGHFTDSERGYRDVPLVTSWREWRDRLRSGGAIYDEYGTEHDVEEFIAHVDALPSAVRRDHHDYVREHYPPGVLGHRSVGVGYGREWLDADQYSFYGGEFS